jgi:hypothetical protein
MAYAFVQGIAYSSNNSTVSTSGIVTFAPSSGNTLILTIAYVSATSVPFGSFTDQSGNPLTMTSIPGTANGTIYSMVSKFLVGCPSGITGVILNVSTPGICGFNISEYSGQAGVLDGFAIGTTTATTAANGIVFPSITTTNQPALFYAVSFDDTHNTARPTAGTGFTTHAGQSNMLDPADSGQASGSTQDKRLTATGSQTATMTNAATSGDLFLCISFSLDELSTSPNTASIAWVT